MIISVQVRTYRLANGEKMWRKYRLIFLIFNTVAAVSPVIKIGALFTEESRGGSAELALKYAVYKINKEKSILPETTLVYDIQYTNSKDSFMTYKKACTQVKTGAVSLFTVGGEVSPVVSAISRSLHVLHVDVSPRADDFDIKSKRYTVNLYPSRPKVDEAFIDLTQFLNWTRMGVIYEDYEDGELNLLNIAKDGRDMVPIKCSTPHEYRSALARIKDQRIRNIIIDVDRRGLPMLFRAILQLQMNNEDHHYIFTSFDMELFDLEDFLYNRVNMSGWRLVDRTSDKVKDALRVMAKFHPIGSSILSGGHIKTETALVYDAVQVLALILASSKMGNQSSVSCETGVPWAGGEALRQNVDTISAHGLTGPIELTNGVRSNFKLELLRLVGDRGPVVSGYWTPNESLVMTDENAYKRDPPANITLTVVTVEEKPYVMVKDGWNLQGNARFEGFCIDLLAHVAAKAGFQYKLRLVPDNMYGVKDPETGQWNGIVRELVDRKADLAVASMTINYAREADIDFTKPFMNLGIGILFKVPTSQPTRLFSFLNPLAVEIWLYVLAAYILVSFTLFVMARFSPYEWSSNSNQHGCGHETRLIENQFSVCNSFWFITGTFLRQGSGLNPKASSTRIVGGIWWFFTLIILSSYTANLAAFLTVERTVLPIQNAADLAAQTAVQYGTLNGGSTMTFFRDSNIDIYQKMWQYMSTANPPTLVSSYEEGVKKVLGGNFAFLMESTMLDHRVQRDCNLTQVGGLLDSKGYGIATYKGSPWRDKISLAILELQEKGVIQILYDKWWKNTGDVCNREGKDSKANPLGVQHIGGVFVTLLCGLVMSIIVAVLEFCWNTRRNPTQGTQSLCSEMGQVLNDDNLVTQELRTAMRGSHSRTVLASGCPRCSPAGHRPLPPARFSEIPEHEIELKDVGW